MKKSIVFIFTFLIMIAITPFIFSKLMNAKFNQMIENVKKEGYKIEEIENKSSYITTDRVFRVVIPQDKLNEDYVKDVVLEVETKFKNLPATHVEFLGKVLRIDLVNGDNKKLNNFIKDKIKFLVITPDFKTFKYKIFKTNLVDDNIEIKTSDISGVYQKPSKNTISFSDLQFILNKMKVEVNNFKSNYEEENGLFKKSIKFNFYILEDKNSTLFKDVVSNLIIYLGDKVKGVENISVSSIKFFDKLIVENPKIEIKLDDVDGKLFKREDVTIRELAKQGFKVTTNIDVKNIKFEDKNLGKFKLTLKVKVKKDNEIFEKIANNNFEDIDEELHIITTPEIATLIISTIPQSVFLFATAKKKNNYIVVDFKSKNGEVIK